MIPVKLEMENFLTYRQPDPLDLTGLHVACLVGANGAGKSSLLDAITWALWGKGRARRDDEMIYGNEIEMQVRLTFMMDESYYRVTRYRSRKGRGSSELGLEILDNERWNTLTESTIRGTQEKIERILRLDYDTFINSAFLAQGRADEFTTKTPGDRKAILSDILSLDAWEAYEERAKKHLRTLDDHTAYVEGQIEAIDNELEKENELRAALDETRQQLDDIVKRRDAADDVFRTLEKAFHERQSLLANYQDREQRVKDAQAELSRIQVEYQQKTERLLQLRQVETTRDEIEEGYQSLIDARDREREYGDRLMKQSDLERQKGELNSVIMAARSTLEAQQQNLHEQYTRLEREISGTSGGDEAYQEAQEKIDALKTRQEEAEGLQKELADLREQRSELVGINQGFHSEIEHFKMQINEIEATTEPECPLCRQELSGEHRLELLDTLREQGKEVKARYDANAQNISELENTIKELKQHVSQAENDVRNLPPLLEHVARLEQKMERVRSAQEELELTHLHLVEIGTILETEDYAPEEQQALADIQQKMLELGYDENAHHEARTLIENFSDFDNRKKDLERALDLIPEITTDLEKLTQQSATWEARIEEDSQQLTEWESEIAALDEQLVGFDECKQELEDLRAEEHHTRELYGRAHQRVKALDDQRERRKELVERRDEYAVEKGIYNDLREAFGKNGVPAMIIEAAIPEIEKEANQILSQMTDGQMHLQFDTQRELVSGGVRETLDIRISDPVGTRDYVTFSGGESFRVDFSIRLALSRLLARRAGAQLRTLIIDEGFGSQDAQGRERLIQAIHSIQDNFDLILVITHIDELKDAFPARIEVTKLSNGSMIEVV